MSRRPDPKLSDLLLNEAEIAKAYAETLPPCRSRELLLSAATLMELAGHRLGTAARRLTLFAEAQDQLADAYEANDMAIPAALARVAAERLAHAAETAERGEPSEDEGMDGRKRDA